jgi:hypothetical protein
MKRTGTLVWSRKNLEEYKRKCNHALAEGHATFIDCNSVHHVWEAKKLIEKFEKLFQQTHLDVVRLQIEF